MSDLVQRLVEVDQATWTIVLVMSLIGAYTLSYTVTGPGIASLGFLGFMATSLSVLAVMRGYGYTFTPMAGGDAVIGSALGMIIVTLTLVSLVALLSKGSKR